MSMLHVVFKVAGAEYAMPASEVLQMESFTGATPVPGAPAHVAGLVQVRGPGGAGGGCARALRAAARASARWTRAWWWASWARAPWGCWWTAPARC